MPIPVTMLGLRARSGAKPISWVTTIMVMPVPGELDHDVEHLLDHLGIEGRGRLVEQHDLRLHAQRAGDGDALLLTARELAGVLVRLLGDAHPLEVLPRRWPRPPCRGIADPHRASVRFSSTVRCGNRLNCWNTMPISRADHLDVLVSLVSSMPSTMIRPLVLLEPVDAADQGRLAGPGRAADNNPFLDFHFQVNSLQDMKISEPFVHIQDFDDVVVFLYVCRVSVSFFIQWVTLCSIFYRNRLLVSTIIRQRLIARYPVPFRDAGCSWTWKNSTQNRSPR
jgi:hypothetical protein